MIDINEIMTLLPHRYPFLLIDRIVKLELNEYIEAIKNVTYNEPFFQGHFPHLPVMPGVLIVEAMAQNAGILAIKTDNISLENKVVYFTGIDKCKFRKPVIPGDTLILKANIINSKGPIWKMKSTAFVKDKLVAEAVLTAAIAESNQ